MALNDNPLMQHAYFITGTGTDSGKTTASALLLNHARSLGLAAAGIKPISSGCYSVANQLYSMDADILRASSNYRLDYAQTAPWRFAPAIAPHLAAAEVKQTISCQDVCQHIERIRAIAGLQCLLIEGAGGWHVPLNKHELYSDVPSSLATPVILVVGISLGCLNSALLTAEAIGRSNSPLAGWVASITDPSQAEPLVQAQIDYLSQALPAPLCGVVPFNSALSQYKGNLSQLTSKLILPFEINPR